MNLHPRCQPSSCFWIQSLVKCSISWRGTPLKEKRVDIGSRIGLMNKQPIRNLSQKAKPLNFTPRPFNKFGAKSKSDFGQIFRSFRIFRLVRRLAEGWKNDSGSEEGGSIQPFLYQRRLTLWFYSMVVSTRDSTTRGAISRIWSLKWKGKGEKKRPNEIRSNELADYEISPESETLWCYCNPLGLLLETPEHITPVSYTHLRAHET